VAESQENVDVVLDGVRRFEAGDFDGVAQRWHPNSRITGPEGRAEPGPFEGRDAVIGQFRRLAANWGQNSVSDLEVVADREDWLVGTFRWEVRGPAQAGSGLLVVRPYNESDHLRPPVSRAKQQSA
jgi:hypothetical protein